MQAEMLARAGVGFMRLIDRDFVEESNLQRQIMYEERDAVESLPKAVAAADRISRINHEVITEPLVCDMNYANAEELMSDADVVLDGTDNFEARFLLNDAAVKLAKPWIYGAVVGSYGVQMTIRPHETPCLRCVFPDMPPPGSPTCDTAGIILPAVAGIATMQVTEALKLMTGQPERLHGALLQLDVWENRWTKAVLGQCEPACPACGLGRFDFLTARSGQLATTLCGRNAVQIAPGSRKEPKEPKEPKGIDLEALVNRLRGVVDVNYNRFLVRFRAEGYELTVFPDGRCIVKGTEDSSVARSLYARYIGG